MRSSFATTLIPGWLKGRVLSLSPRRFVNILAPAMVVVLVILHVIGCSSINEQIGPTQQIQRALDALNEMASRFEKKQDWVSYANVQNNLGVTYRIHAELGIEPEQNLQRSLDAHKEGARRSKELQIWGDYAKAQGNLGVTYRALAQRGVEPEQNLQRSLDLLKEVALRSEELQIWGDYAQSQDNLGVPTECTLSAISSPRRTFSARWTRTRRRPVGLRNYRAGRATPRLRTT